MPQPLILTDEQFREAAQAGSAPADAQVRKGFVTEVKAPADGEDSRALEFIISTAAVDRMGDTIAVDGWKLANFRKNPVVLWAHDASMLPVAKASNIRVEDGKLMARAEFMPREISGFADAVYRALKGGFLSATSVGFAPIKYAFSEDSGRRFGIDFIEQELLEFSVVPVPANQEALIQARAAGVDVTPIRDWALRLLASDNLAVIDVERLAAITSLPEEFRADAKKASGAKGASGLYRRCANRIERALKGEVALPLADPIEDPESHPQPTADAAAGFSDIASRRLITLRRKTAA